ncbi:MAG: shikimate kinase [Pseudomonadota bacterium]
MELVFLHGPVAVGKLTVAQALAERTGLPLFHNHLVVDALLAAFEFGGEPFVKLREQMWLAVFEEAARAGRSLIFTFAPEATVRPAFIPDTVAAVEAHGGRVRFVALTAPVAEQERRLTDESRAAFGKMRDVAFLRQLKAQGAMDYPPIASELTIDTGGNAPEASASLIAEALQL